MYWIIDLDPFCHAAVSNHLTNFKLIWASFSKDKIFKWQRLEIGATDLKSTKTPSIKTISRTYPQRPGSKFTFYHRNCHGLHTWNQSYSILSKCVPTKIRWEKAKPNVKDSKIHIPAIYWSRWTSGCNDSHFIFYFSSDIWSFILIGETRWNSCMQIIKSHCLQFGGMDSKAVMRKLFGLMRRFKVERPGTIRWLFRSFRRWSKWAHILSEISRNERKKDLALGATGMQFWMMRVIGSCSMDLRGNRKVQVCWNWTDIGRVMDGLMMAPKFGTTSKTSCCTLGIGRNWNFFLRILFNLCLFDCICKEFWFGDDPNIAVKKSEKAQIYLQNSYDKSAALSENIGLSSLAFIVRYTWMEKSVLISAHTNKRMANISNGSSHWLPPIIMAIVP